MTPFNKNNIYGYEAKESWTKTIFTGLVMILSLTLICLLYVTTLKGGI